MGSVEYESRGEDLIQLRVLDSKTEFHKEKERCLDSSRSVSVWKNEGVNVYAHNS